MAFTPSVISKQQKYTITPAKNNNDFNDSSTCRSSRVSHRSKYYVNGGILDTRENRNVEFKAAQGKYIYDILPSTVERYGCAFANGEGGMLYLGIKDDGVITGVRVSSKDEEHILRTIQRTFDKFLPRPPSHSVRLIPLCSLNMARVFPNYKVVEISVRGGTLSDIFETGDHKVFIKRDGSIELQNALQIKDLAITKYKQMLEQRGTATKTVSS
ncbi:schlafen-like protein 1 [Acanthaster planci]|uniref:Schlafen-like protein 1 n=1 Tax=Acanthaster planci TaxID=133434 RepID=A0A8B7YPF2_ACAPL|nr:schlafen-like protein 1 [Acanthaster planci]XP_022094547.1 schlafen-like protein 1 [Acanthaster planci]XP_022094548.1 schlafen-like protein 1 [Acanthaster planci]XP_022094550.1 schlafen-like protein 1 [Acanthaster planci]